jgi:Mitochondrial biogenesis AIM24
MQTTLAQFNEVPSTEAFSLQNPKLLRVRLDQVTVQARRDAVVGWRGVLDVEDGGDFSRVAGAGEVYLAHRVRDVHLVKLEVETITVNAGALLAFDAGITIDHRETEQGERHAVLEGTGFLAVVSDGPPVVLDVASAPTYADPRAAVAWSENVRVSGSDGALSFDGQGWVLVQPGAA